MIIDAHAHITTALNKKFGRQSHKRTMQILLEEMQQNQVAHTFVIASFRDGVASPQTKETIELVKDCAQLHVIGTIDLENYVQKDLDALEEHLKKREIIGIKLYLGYQHIYAYDKRCHPIYELCTKYNVPAMFHTGDTFRADGKVRYAHPLAIDDVAVDFPHCKLVIAHVGNPWMETTAEILYKNENVYADISGLVVCDGFHTPDGELAKKRLKELIAYASAKKLIYGTDWPLAKMTDYIEFAESLEIEKADFNYVMSKNARDIFNI